MKGGLPFAATVVAAIALVSSAAGAAGGGAAGPPARSAATSLHRISLSAAKGIAKPRGLAGLPKQGGYGFLLKLRTEATGRAYETTLPEGRSAARAAAKNQLATVRTAERNVIAALPSGSHILYETHALLAGVGVYTNVRNLPALQRIAGVAAVYPIAPKKPSLSYSVELVRAPQAWQAYSDLGANTSIAIIDTGVDYTHANFGGPGTVAAYNTALANDTAAPTYPDPTKIVGGYDFAGDAYDARDPNNATPAPDPNPLDCDGHGTHVSGIAAGYGENPKGTTFTGDYLSLGSLTSSAYRATFRIGPGMAPKAKIYAYKVFGCAGSTNVVAAALDKAADPNGDGSTSDHVGVVNMSLGADFASPQDADSVATNDAVQLGISVVAAAGNGSDLYDIAGSPGNASRAISVASSVDAYSQIDTLHGDVNSVAENYGAQRSVAYDWTNNPDLSGDVVKLTEGTNTDGCDPLNPTDAALVAGKIVFLEWTSDDTQRRCGSAARSANVESAGAIGAILGEDQETFSAGITGSANIPVVQVVESAANAIRTALNASQTVTISGTTANDFSQLIPGNDDEVSSFSSRGIGDAGNVKPDVTGIGTSVFSSAMGTGDQGISFSGTSMASPEVAGLSALVRTKHPTWSPEQVKADIMNTAEQDLFTGTSHSGNRYGPERAGAGRIDAKSALDNQVLAYVANDPGAVSASFGPIAVSTATMLTKTIDVANKGGSSATYNVSYSPITTVPGATYSVSPSSVTMAAGETKTVTLTLTINPSLLTKPIDATVNRTQATFARDYKAEASGRVVLASPGQPTLRVPVYAAPRPAAVMTQPSSTVMPTGTVQTAALPLSGTGLSQGTGLNSIQSLVSGFELQATSGTLPTCTATLTSGCIHASDELAADLKYLGTTSDAPELRSINIDPIADGLEYFAITTQGPWRTPASENEYDIYIDSNGDGIPDDVLFNTRLSGTDVFASALYNLTTQQIDDAEPIDDRLGGTDADVFDSDTLVMPVAISTLPGISATSHRITYGVVTFGSFSSDPVDTAGVHISGNNLSLDGTLSTDVLKPGVAVFGSFTGAGSPLLYKDMPGTTLHVQRDAATYAADHGHGALIVHFQNAVGNKAQVVQLLRDTTPPKLLGLKVKVNHRSRTAKVTFRGTDPGNGSKGLRFKCKLDHGPMKSCSSPKVYKHLRRGKHTVQVEAIDKAGNVSKPLKRRFKV